MIGGLFKSLPLNHSRYDFALQPDTVQANDKPHIQLAEQDFRRMHFLEKIHTIRVQLGTSSSVITFS